MPIFRRILLPLLAVTAACAPAPQPAAAPLPAPPPPPVAAPPEAPERAPEREVPVPAAFAAALERETRAPSGAPGEAYWQQRVRYRIDAELDPRTATLRGMESIVYHNRSPLPLRSLVLNLYQNVFAEGVPRNRYVNVTGGVTLQRVAAQGRALERRRAREIPVVPEPAADAPMGYAVEGTLARLVLPRPVAPGDSVVLEVEWRHRVPPAPSFRTGYDEALGARAFHVAQWYPQIATLDDVYGWDATPYLGDGEFYLEYGDFDVSVSLPEGYLVGATGVLQNPEEVLTEEARIRLAAALRADTVTAVVTEADLEADNATQRSPDGQLTWRFRAENVRDFAFATSRRYVWDVARATVSDGRSVPVHALYRAGAPSWTQAARFGEHATEFFSELLIPYLYPQITIAEGPIGGMEYPQIVFITRRDDPASLYSTVAHEVAHEWFPMMVGTNEAAYAWMDEGFATFMDALAQNDFYPDRDVFAGDRTSYLRVAGTEAEVPLMRHTDLVSPYGARGVAAYTKPGVLLRSLRSVVGDSAFAAAMRTYAREWLLKHPYPWDFFNTMERVSGQELDWFFRPWWFETGVLDLAVEAVEGAGGETGRVTVRVRSQGEISAPTLVEVVTASGTRLRETIPVEAWRGGARTASISFSVTGPVARVEIDPERLFPDVDLEDNTWTPR